MHKDFHILIVEDELDICRAIALRLKTDGFSVYEALNAEECMSILKYQTVDLILLDVMLPDANGIELSEEIKQNAEFKDIYILFMSANKNLRDEIVETENNRIIGFITKPLRLLDLSERIHLIYRVYISEKQKSRTETKLNYIIDNAGDIVFALDNEGKFQLLNAAFEIITGHNGKESLNKYMKDFLNDESMTAWESIFSELKEKKTVRSFDLVFRTEKNTFIPVECSLSIIENYASEPIFLGLAKDLSEQKTKAFDLETNEQKTKEREVKTWEKLSETTTLITSRIYEASSFIKNNEDVYKKMIINYGSIITNCIDNRIYKIDYDPKDDLSILAHALGFNKANHKDVIRLHNDYYNAYIKEKYHPKRIKIYFEEARFILLQLMGLLVNYYRNRNS